ncbi:ATP-binding protein [Thiomonas sp. FB-Cd]|uniref:ATP-binding protein n=1 Tax=Thiomonas sp. FB-Cd TaxID=1158292 RepID=UPI000A8B7685|nr:ATP-binding protein [Thiomonas sp. FB-Cd]
MFENDTSPLWLGVDAPDLLRPGAIGKSAPPATEPALDDTVNHGPDADVEFPSAPSPATAPAPVSVLPPAVRRVQDTGVSEALLLELMVKVLYLRGQMRLPELSAHVCLPATVLEALLGFLRSERLCEMSRRGETDAAMAFNLTELGRNRARDFLRRSQYAGPAPVGLEAYVAQVRHQSVKSMRVTQPQLQVAFRGVVIRPQITEQFGAAMNSGRAIFVYGPPGSGKTYVSELLVRLLSGHVAIPHAVAVDNEIMQIYDPMVHCAVDEPLPHQGLDRGTGRDLRWVACERPVVRTGAELTLPMVDLQFDREAGFYQAPPQVKANNGLFIIDDLGRQLVPAQSLMNRWIVPLDRAIDFLGLHTGAKFLVPFDVIVVFSSNLLPSQLADEAFLRRLGYKIHMGHIDEPDYRAIFQQVCDEFEIPYSSAAVEHLLQHHAAEDRPLLACLPRDLLEQVRDRARFQGEAATLSAANLDWAWNNYFAKH